MPRNSKASEAFAAELAQRREGAFDVRSRLFLFDELGRTRPSQALTREVAATVGRHAELGEQHLGPAAEPVIDREPLSAANRDRVYWYGDMSFAPHLWDLLGTNRIEVSVKIRPRIETALLRKSSQGRKELSQACYDAVTGGLTAQTEKSPEPRGHSQELSAVNRSEKKPPSQALTSSSKYTA